jgi:hypothetical protein
MAQKKTLSKKKIIRPSNPPIFVPIIYKIYRKNKMALLNAQIKVFGCIKTIDSIRNLQKKRESLKLELYRLLSQIIRLQHQTQNLLPITKNLQPLKKPEKTIEIKVNYNDSPQYSKKVSQLDNLDNELREIQLKLNSLNNLKDSN